MLRPLVVPALAFALAIACSAVAHAQFTTIENLNPEKTTVFASDPQGAMKQARSLVAAGDLEGAIHNLSRYVTAHPSEADPARLLGDLYYRAGEFDRAEATYRAILAQYPHDKETHNRLGTVYATENRVDPAIDEFNKSLPGTDSIVDLVQLHQRKGDFLNYERNMERAASNYPSDSVAQSELAQVYLAINRLYDAKTEFMRSLDDDSTSLTSLNGMGVTLIDLHQYDDAVKYFTRCLVIDANNYTCIDNTAAAYLEAGKYTTAEPILAHALALAPERGEALVNYGYLADARNDWKGAINWYLRALAMSPFERDAYFNLGIEYEQHGLYQQSEAVVIKGLSIAPEDSGLHVLLGLTYRDLGERDLARKQFQLAADSPDQTYAGVARRDYAELSGGKSPTPQLHR